MPEEKEILEKKDGGDIEGCPSCLLELRGILTEHCNNLDPEKKGRCHKLINDFIARVKLNPTIEDLDNFFSSFEKFEKK